MRVPRRPPAARHTFGAISVIAAAVILTAAAPACADGPAVPVSFRNEVMAVLSRAGCNAGACHGNQNGKGGFKLSLRGEDPDFDLLALTRGTLARRVDPQHPDDSLVLLKASASIPHEGGQRFRVGSAEYALLHANGSPAGALAPIRPVRPYACGAWRSCRAELRVWSHPTRRCPLRA